MLQWYLLQCSGERGHISGFSCSIS